MFTIISVPKAFIDPHTSIIQRNAISSWNNLNPKPEIILFGDDYGIDLIASELNLRHIKDVSKTDLGTPLLNTVFEITEKEASYDTICYVNADIIIFPNIINTIKIVNNQKFLILGQRWDYNQLDLINFNESFDYDKYLSLVKNNGTLHAPAGSDYFIYKKNTLKNMPEFAVGRAAWDNWFISYFYKKRIPIINASKSLTVIHQNHDYNHIKKRSGNTYRGEESTKNLSFFPKNEQLYTINDSTYFIKDGKVTKNISFIYLQSRYNRFKRKHIVPILSFIKRKILRRPI